MPSTTNVSDTIVRAQAATLPQARVNSIDVFYQGRPLPVAGNRTYVPWTARFYNEIDFALRDFFEAWSNHINTFEGNQAETTDFINATNGGYAVDGVIVRQFSKQLGLVRSYIFYGMYPEVVGDIELNWQDANRIETFDVQFRYAYWLPAGGVNSPSGVDTTVASPGSYDTVGTGAASGVGSIPVTVVGASINNPSATVAGTSVNTPGTAQTPTIINVS